MTISIFHSGLASRACTVARGGASPGATQSSHTSFMNNPPGKKMLIFNISSNDYSFIIFGVMLLGIAWVMVEATRLAQENAEFV